MGLYDTGSGGSSVDFAEKTFSEVRKRRDAIAEDQEKFHKRLALANLAVQGTNAVLNSRADALERSQAPKRAAYEATIENGVHWRGVHNEILKSGKSREQYLVDKFYTSLLEDAQRSEPNINLTGFQSAILKRAKDQAANHLDSFNSILDSSLDIPTFEDFDEFYRSHNTLPRNVGSWATGKISNLFKTETPETLADAEQQLINDQNTKLDALFGTEMGEQLSQFRNNVRAFRATSKDSSSLLDELAEEVKAGNLKGKPIGDPQIITSGWTRVGNGDKEQRTITTIIHRADRLTGEPIEFRNEHIEIRDYFRETATVNHDALMGYIKTLTPEGQTLVLDMVDDADKFDGEITAESFYDIVQEVNRTNNTQGIGRLILPDLDREDKELENIFNQALRRQQLMLEGKPYATKSLDGSLEINKDDNSQLAAMRDGTTLNQIYNAEFTKLYSNSNNTPTDSSELTDFIEKNDASNLIGALSSDQSDSNFALITEAFKDAVPTAELEGLESYQEDEVLFGQFIKLNAEGQAFTQQELARLFNVNIEGVEFSDNLTFNLFKDLSSGEYYTSKSETTVEIPTVSEDRSLDTSGELALDTKGGQRVGGRNPIITPIRYELKEGIFNTAVDKVDISNLTAGQLKTLSEMNDNEIRDKLELDSNISLRTPARGTFGSRFDNPNVISRAESLIEENQLRRWQDISGAEVPQEFWDSLKSLLIEGSRTYLQEDE